MKGIILSVGMFFCLNLIKAQEIDSLKVVANTNTVVDSVKVAPNDITKTDTVKTKQYFKNNFKINLSGLTLNNYSFSYERSISRKITVGLGYRYMPSTKLSSTALSKKLIRRFGDDFDFGDDLDNANMSNNAITAEVRFYWNKKPGPRGGYVAIYGRYATFNYTYDWDYGVEPKSTIIPIAGDAKSWGAGLVFGWQFFIAKRVVLDIYFMGGHYGHLTGALNGEVDTNDWTQEEKDDLESEILNTEILGKPIFNSYTSTTNGFNATVSTPMFGIRALGLSVGFAF